jgi:hypothetical protein
LTRSSGIGNERIAPLGQLRSIKYPV